MESREVSKVKAGRSARFAENARIIEEVCIVIGMCCVLTLGIAGYELMNGWGALLVCLLLACVAFAEVAKHAQEPDDKLTG